MCVLPLQPKSPLPLLTMPPKKVKEKSILISPPKGRIFCIPLVNPPPPKHLAIFGAIRRRKRKQANLPPFPQDIEIIRKTEELAVEAATKRFKQNEEKATPKKTTTTTTTTTTKQNALSVEEEEAKKMESYKNEELRAEKELEAANETKNDFFWLLKQVITSEAKR